MTREQYEETLVKHIQFVLDIECRTIFEENMKPIVYRIGGMIFAQISEGLLKY